MADQPPASDQSPAEANDGDGPESGPPRFAFADAAPASTVVAARRGRPRASPAAPQGPLPPKRTRPQRSGTGRSDSGEPARKSARQLTAAPPCGASVVVVGAGFAGLAAAHDLAAFGYDVRVLEARNRVGGRCWTDSSLGGPVELGAAWIHGTEGNPLAELCAAKGAATVHIDERTVIYDVDGRPLSQEEDSRVEHYYNELLEAARQTLKEGEPDISLGSGIAAQMARANGPPPAPQAAYQRRILDWNLANLEYSVNADVDELSLRFGLDVDGLEFAFPGPHVFLRDGYGAVVQSLAAGLAVEFNTPVSRIEYGDERPRVITQAGREWECDAVVVTVPLGVLKGGLVQFHPPLPGPHQSAIQRLGFGLLNKLVLTFEATFWGCGGAKYIGHAGRKGHFYLFIDVTDVARIPTLMALLPANAARALEGFTDEEVVCQAMEVLAALFPSTCPRGPQGYSLTRWGADPYSRGSYSFMAVGATEADLLSLAQPVSSRLFFAGEATCMDCPATAHGAFISGRRVACQVVATIPGRRREACPLLKHLLRTQAALPTAAQSATAAQCQVCRQADGHESLLLCDRCNAGCHTYCLKPSVPEIPEGEWYCPSCIAKCITANELYTWAQQALRSAAKAGLPADPAMAAERLTAAAVRITYGCCLCAHSGKGKDDLVRHYASRGHADRLKALWAGKTYRMVTGTAKSA